MTSPSSPTAASKLEELPQVILSSLSPGNIKRTAADFMREWEKSLSTPSSPPNGVDENGAGAVGATAHYFDDHDALAHTR